VVKTILYKRTIALGTSKPIDFRACALLSAERQRQVHVTSVTTRAPAAAAAAAAAARWVGRLTPNNERRYRRR